MDNRSKRRNRGESGRSVRGRWRVCVQVWDTVRWITQTNRQFVTVRKRESEGGREGEKKMRGGTRSVRID